MCNIKDSCNHQKEKPEPNDSKDLLNEQVDGQHTLRREGLQVVQLTNLNVAHNHPGEMVKVAPFSSVIQVTEDLKAIGVEVESQESGKKNKLANYVNQVENFSEEVESSKVGAMTLTKHETEDARHLLSHANHNIVLVNSIGFQPSINEM